MALNLMLQGTMSNAGKSLLAAALCASEDTFHGGDAAAMRRSNALSAHRQYPSRMPAMP